MPLFVCLNQLYLKYEHWYEDNQLYAEEYGCNREGDYFKFVLGFSQHVYPAIEIRHIDKRQKHVSRCHKEQIALQGYGFTKQVP